MPILIKKKSGVTTVVAKSPPAPEPRLPSRRPDWWKKQDALIDQHCAALAKVLPASLSHRDNVMIAALLGYGSEESHEKLWKDGTIDMEWVKIVPWFLHPEIGEALLPTDATWSIANMDIDGERLGKAVLEIPSSGKGPWLSTAASAWAAWAIVLLQAFKDDAYVPKIQAPKPDNRG